ncbi:hypothetical protein J3R30DRAFT_2722469 [Lentinula aciculospora]|uniref:Uncharacterized protein n=1 Tax=Lentinula aciculospora TaxID=153920 RepID=A0A9W9DNY9_9AGAR|nr:hypothetical protein J3R30DRAFT_2722469 [Lentinula aciculospora]
MDSEPSSMGFKRGLGGQTPPPAYTPNIAGSSSLSQAQNGNPGANFDPYSPYNSVNYNPWATVPTPAHPNPVNSGPTPASALHIPYAYYDPRSAHSLAEADTRAKWRFWLTLLWVLGVWVLCGLLASWIEQRHPGWFEDIEDGWHHWSVNGRF